MEEGGDQPWAHLGLVFFKERRNEREKGRKDTARLSLYPEIALHEGHLQMLARTFLWPC